MAVDIAQRSTEGARGDAYRGQMRALWRLAGWGGAAAIALGSVALAVRSETGRERLAGSLASEQLPVRAVATVKMPPLKSEKDIEARRLEARVQALADDRDRLIVRIAGLEQQLDDVTGSIKRQADMPPAAEPAPVAADKPVETATAETPPALMVPPPVTAPPIIAPLARPAIDAPAAFWSSAAQQQAKLATPPQETPSAAETDAKPTLDHVPLPPARIANVPPDAEDVPPKPAYGVALTRASSVDIMRLQWAAVKANFGSMLGGLHPYAVRERNGSATRFRLVVGPLPDYKAAANLCARLTAARASCRPVRYVGDRL